MKKIIQNTNFTIEIPTEDINFEYLEGTQKFDENEPYVDYKLSIAYSGDVFLPDEIISTSEDIEIYYETNVSIYMDKIVIYLEYIPTFSWAEKVTTNILSKFNNKYDSFPQKLHVTNEHITDKSKFSVSHPLFESKDIVEIFNYSIYNFHQEKLDVDELSDIGLNNVEETKIFVLKNPFDEHIGVYYVPEYDLFHFNNNKSELIADEFNNILYKLFEINSPIEELYNPFEDFINTGALIPWVFWNGYSAIHMWDYISPYLALEENEEYNRRECYNYVREFLPDISRLHLQRMEAELLDVLDYEYPITSVNYNKMKSLASEVYNKDVSKLLWENGPGYMNHIQKYVNKSTSLDAFNYDQNIGRKGDILYYNLDHIPAKIAVQLKKYKPVIPIDTSKRYREAKDITPFAWYAKIIGVKKLDNNLTEEEIENAISPQSYYLLYHSVFDEASELLFKEIEPTLDIIYNKPDTSAWD